MEPEKQSVSYPWQASTSVCKEQEELMLKVLPAGILYHDMYTNNLVGAHVEMQSLEVRCLC